MMLTAYSTAHITPRQYLHQTPDALISPTPCPYNAIRPKFLLIRSLLVRPAQCQIAVACSRLEARTGCLAPSAGLPTLCNVRLLHGTGVCMRYESRYSSASCRARYMAFHCDLTSPTAGLLHLHLAFPPPAF